MIAADAPRFSSIFNGTTLAGWHPQGTADWRVEDSSIIGSVRKSDNAGGWLVLDHAYEDFILDISVRCMNCEGGVLLRDAPVSWSHFSHAADVAGNTSGLYVSLSGADAGAMSARRSLPGPWL